jgi:hypothetical protein
VEPARPPAPRPPRKELVFLQARQVPCRCLRNQEAYRANPRTDIVPAPLRQARQRHTADKRVLGHAGSIAKTPDYGFDLELTHLLERAYTRRNARLLGILATGGLYAQITIVLFPKRQHQSSLFQSSVTATDPKSRTYQLARFQKGEWIPNEPYVPECAHYLHLRGYPLLAWGESTGEHRRCRICDFESNEQRPFSRHVHHPEHRIRLRHLVDRACLESTRCRAPV